MKNKFILVVLVIVLSAVVFRRCSIKNKATFDHDKAIITDDSIQNENSNIGPNENTNTEAFSCQGKTRCSEMVSCAEAMYYLNNCPNVEIDGDHNGIPCEKQWCGHK